MCQKGEILKAGLKGPECSETQKCNMSILSEISILRDTLKDSVRTVYLVFFYI